MRYFVKFGYSGSAFTGFQRGNGTRSVEDEIISALSRMGMDTEIASAARTDRGVSATGNVFSMQCSTNIGKAMADLNRFTENMAFHSFAEVPDGLSPRHNDSKVYRYIVFGIKFQDIEHKLKKFEGRHDFSAFARVDKRNPVRTIDSIEISDHGEYIAVDFHARSFIWQQIRRIMGFVMHQVSAGTDTDPFSGHGIVKLAPPELLILLDISYRGIEFKQFNSPKLRKQISAEAEKARMKSVYMKNLSSRLYDCIYSSKS